MSRKGCCPRCHNYKGLYPVQGPSRMEMVCVQCRKIVRRELHEHNMGIIEDRKQKQIHFCFICNGPGTSTWDENRKVCQKCFLLLQTWNCHPKPPRVVLKTTEEQKNAYRELRLAFLETHPWCEVALKLRGELVKSNTVHHKKGRAIYFLDVTTFLATTKEGDRWIHQNRDVATTLGWLA